MRFSIEKIISPAIVFCFSSPLSRVMTRDFSGFGSSSAVISQGPKLPDFSKFLPMPKLRLWRWYSRTDPSL